MNKSFNEKNNNWMNHLVAGVKLNCFLWLKSGFEVRLTFSVVVSYTGKT